MNKNHHTGHIKQEHSLLIVLQYVLFGGLILYFGKSLFIPLAFAALVSFVLYPICSWLEKRGVGRATAIILCVSFLTIVMIGISILLASQFVAFVEEWPSFQSKVSAAVNNLSEWMINSYGITQEQQSQWLAKATDQVFVGVWSFLQGAIAISAFSAVMLILIPVYTVLILYYRHIWVNVLCRIFYRERRESIHEALILTIQTYYNFIKGMGVVYLTVGILNSVGLLILGVPHAILFGFIASVLTFIPYVGIMVGSLLPITMSWVAYDSIWYPVGVIAIFTFVQYLEANVIFPFAVSSRLNVNTLVVLLAIFLGGIIWGVAGMILFVPFVGILKLLADHHDFKTISILLGTENPK